MVRVREIEISVTPHPVMPSHRQHRDHDQQQHQPHRPARPPRRHRRVRPRDRPAVTLIIRRRVARGGPDEGDDPADQGPAQQQVEQEDRAGGEMSARQRDDRGQEIDEKPGDEHGRLLVPRGSGGGADGRHMAISARVRKARGPPCQAKPTMRIKA